MSKIDEEQTPYLELSDLGCSDVKALSSLLVDEALVPVLKERVLEHLEQCESCTELVRELHFLLQEARQLADTPIPRDSQHRLRVALREKVGFISPKLSQDKSNTSLS